MNTRRQRCAFNRWVLALLAASLTCVWCHVGSVAASQPEVRIESVQLEGEDIKVEVRLHGFTDLAGADLTLYVDPTCVHIVEVEAGNFPGMTTLNIQRSVPGSEGLDAVACIIDDYRGHDGDFVMFTVRLSPVAQCEEQPFVYSGFGFGSTPLFVRSDLASIEVAYRNAGTYEVLATPDTGYESTETDNDVPADTALDDPADIDSPYLVWESDDEDSNAAAAPQPTLTVSPSQVAPGQEVAVSARLCNTGTEVASRTVSLLVNGAEDQSQSVTVDAGQCREVQFATSRTGEGTYIVSIDEMTGEFTVVAAAVPPPPPPPPGQEMPDTTTSGINTTHVIIAVAGAALVIIAALLFFLRRR